MPGTHQTAANAGLKFLYHYQKFNPAYLTTLLRDKKIFCSDPSSMNDPWDFKPAFDWEPMMIDRGNLVRMLDVFRSAAGPDVVNHPLRPVFEKMISSSDVELERFVTTASTILAKELWKRRIYCLTPLSNSILMWSHYAQNHTGVCLEFRADSVLFSGAMKVNYRETYPTFTPQDAILDPLSMILVKAVDWAYEGEYRLVGNQNFPGSPNHLDGPYITLPPDALSAIIIGCEAKRESIEKLIRKFAPKLLIKRTQRLANKYKLEIV